MTTPEYVQLTDVGGTNIKPVTDLAAINLTTTNGIVVDASNGGTIGVADGFVESRYYNNMIAQGVGPATPEDTYVDGGTMYTLLGGYEVSDDVPSVNASPYKVPSEVAVRTAIDAYVATGGSNIVPGAGINVNGGSINVTAGNGIDLTGGSVSVKPSTGITVDSTGVKLDLVAGDGIEFAGGTASADIATVNEVLHGTADANMVDADGLTGALSLGQAVDVSSPIRANDGSTLITPTFTDDNLITPLN